MRVSVGGVGLFFDVDGAKLVPEGPWMRERPTVMLVHSGPGFDHQIFKTFLGPRVAAFAQVVYLDLRGHGRSDRVPPEQLRLDVWADDVRAFCDALGIERPFVLGHGFGALVVTRFASRHPDALSALVAEAPYARVVPARMVEAFDRLGGSEAGEAARCFYDDPGHATLAEYLRVCYPLVVPAADSAEELSRSVFAADTYVEWTRAEGLTFDLRDELARMTVPTLVLAGEDDPYSPISAVREFAEALPPELVRFRSFAGARHPVFRDSDPHALDELRSFVTEITERESAAAAESLE